MGHRSMVVAMNITMTIDPVASSLHIGVRAALDYPPGHVARLVARVIEDRLRELEPARPSSQPPRPAAAGPDCRQPHRGTREAGNRDGDQRHPSASAADARPGCHSPAGRRPVRAGPRTDPSWDDDAHLDTVIDELVDPVPAHPARRNPTGFASGPACRCERNDHLISAAAPARAPRLLSPDRTPAPRGHRLRRSGPVAVPATAERFHFLVSAPNSATPSRTTGSQKLTVNIDRQLIDQAKDAFWLARGEYRTFSGWVEAALRRHIDATKEAPVSTSSPSAPAAHCRPVAH
jgi:hypothetical protein